MTRRHSSSVSVAGAFGMLAVSGAIVLGLVSGCTPSDGATPPPKSPGTSSPDGKSSSPSPSPTLDPEEVAIAGAKAGYVAYWKALDELGSMGGSDRATSAMKDTMTGKELRSQTDGTKRAKANGFSSKGNSVVREMVVEVVNVGHEPPLVSLRTCVDLSGSKAFQHGHPLPGAPKAFKESPELVMIDGKWKVKYATNKEVKSCK